MGCGNDANVYFSRAVFPDSFKLLFLQHLEKFGLKTDGYLGDFVQKERTAVCNLNPSHTILVSTGESAFEMAEEFAFEHLSGTAAQFTLMKGRCFRGLRS
jgi:hypothetical protein